MKKLIFVLIPILIVIGCKKDPVQYAPENSITLTCDDTILYVNQSPSTMLHVTLDTFNPNVTIDLKVENGLIDGEAEIKNIQVLNDSTKTISRKLTPTNAEGKCTVTATISGTQFFVTQSIQLVNQAPDSILTLSFDNTNLKINTAEASTFEIYLNPDFESRNISLTYEKGKVNGLPSPMASSSINAVDGLWTGTFRVDSSASPGVYPFKVSVDGTEYSKTIYLNLSQDAVDDVLSFSVTSTGPYLADGVSTYTVQANVANHTAATVMISNGTSTNTVDVIGGVATTSFTTSQIVETLNISCTLANPAYTKSVVVSTEIAYPETSNLLCDSWTIDSTDLSLAKAINFTYKLGRSSGKVSEGRGVTAEAYQLIGGVKTNFGTFYDLPAFSNAAEEITTQYFASPGLDPALPLIFVFSTPTAVGTTSDTLVLDVTN